jgi:hypothetical protein
MFDENISQMTRMSRRKHDLAQPAGIQLRSWMSDDDFMGVVRPPHLYKSGYFIHSQPLPLPRESSTFPLSIACFIESASGSHSRTEKVCSLI